MSKGQIAAMASLSANLSLNDNLPVKYRKRLRRVKKKIDNLLVVFNKEVGWE